MNSSPTLAIQRKLTIGASDDPLEREADRIADQVMLMTANTAVNRAPIRIQRFTGSSTGAITEVPPSVDQVLSSPGRPLERELRQDMESRFGYDFSNVHSGSTAEKSAHDVNANAYTAGHNFIFGTGQFALLQRDLALEPTNPTPQEINLTAGQIRDAINFNRRRYDAESTRLIQDVVGAQQAGTFDEETIRLIARYQDDFGLTPADGKVGPDTFDQLTAELQAENVDDQTCLTMFNVSNPTIPLDIRVAGPGLADIFSRFNVTARFSPHCNCDEFEYRQFICGSVDRTQGGVVTNMNNVFSVPGGGLPQCPGWVEDGDTTAPQNGRYGHRNHTARVNNRYLDDTDTVDMTNGCRFSAFDVPGLFSVPDNSGDRYDFDIRFFGDVRRNGRRIERKFWAIRDSMTIP
ncbi:MAG: eCIS core domain-containing protein [Nitrosospira sp.]